MAAVIGWLVAHWSDLVGVVLGLLAVASVITKLTPSPADDAVVAKIIAFLSFLRPQGVSGLKLPLTRHKDEPLLREREDLSDK
jgi:hypothetical protein